MTIPPAKELFASADELYQAGEKVEKRLGERLSVTKETELREKLNQSIGYDIEQLKNGTYFTGMYKYISQIYPECQSLVDYMPSDTLVILDEPNRIIESARQMERGRRGMADRLVATRRAFARVENIFFF